MKVNYYLTITGHVVMAKDDSMDDYAFRKHCFLKSEVWPEPKKKIKKPVWINYYKNGDVYAHPNENSANHNSDSLGNCQTIKIEIEVEE
jgi:hypothetical protein